MPPVATFVPAETDLLCEGCGYTLNGLAQTGNCPECGKPIGSSLGEHRALSSYEARPSLSTFFDTTFGVLFAPAHFYRSISTRVNSAQAATFARRHRLVATFLLWLAVVGHFSWLAATTIQIQTALWLVSALTIVGPLTIYLILIGVTSLAAWLSAIEAKYWGMRLPRPVVRRGLQFHSACYLPVGLLAVSVVLGHWLLLMSRLVGPSNGMVYLYTLCAAVILSAAYLFAMYWIAMKNMMYANR